MTRQELFARNPRPWRRGQTGTVLDAAGVEVLTVDVWSDRLTDPEANAIATLIVELVNGEAA